jgi:hypothetical protein
MVRRLRLKYEAARDGELAIFGVFQVILVDRQVRFVDLLNGKEHYYL